MTNRHFTRPILVMLFFFMGFAAIAQNDNSIKGFVYEAVDSKADELEEFFKTIKIKET